MQDQNKKSNNSDKIPLVAPVPAAQADFVRKIADKIKNSENILVALSRDPSVDEIAAAIGLALFLDGIQKHTTAIYSGRTPDALAFLRPEETFETDTDSLQDFIIALSKDKADHLRYKLDGDFVKVFITPYKTKITEQDLSYSYGDYNVDFVIGLNVRSVADLDDALAEHGRIMHDASAVDITTGEPGRFGEIEWSNPAASSVSEMVTELIFAVQGSDVKLDADIATALLTGIVAATQRFSNNRTTSETLGLASKLMTMGADQQLISANVVDNQIIQNEHDETQAEAMRRANASGDFVVNNSGNGLDVNAVPGNDVAGGATSVNSGTAAANSMMNPAAQIVQGMNTTPTGPVPAEMTTGPAIDVSGSVVAPVLPVAANGAGTVENVSAESAEAMGANLPNGMTVSQPTHGILDNANGASVTNGAATADPMNNIAGPAREMVSAAPAQAVAPQVGTAVERPAPEEPKDYAALMEQALAEPAPVTAKVVNSTTATMPPNPTLDQLATDEQTGAQMAAPAQKLAVNAQGEGLRPAAEPVMNPFDGVLPPPPAPTAGQGMMPPSLPPVQMPPNMA